MTIYLDNDFKCHVSPEEGFTAIESDFFDGKCDAFIGCYRLIPDGHAWTREDGAVFTGEMIAPHKDLSAALIAQQVYEDFMMNVADYVAAYNEGVESA